MGFPICLSVFGNTQSLCQILQQYSDEADLFEIRLDLSEQLDLHLIRKSATKPLIFASHQNPELLKDAIPFADFIDVGTSGNSPSANQIVSFHGSEEDSETLWHKLHGDHITKIVLDTNDYSKILKLLELNRRPPESAICFAMGEIGAFSRILSVFNGARWIYASLQDQPTANGQFSIDQLIKLYRVKRFSEPPSVIGILGNPVSHSKSPAFHNQKFSEHNLPWIYLPFPCDDLDSLMKHARAFGVAGFSVTYPFKERILDYLKISSEEVQKLRSCNTLFWKDDGWHGINTDVVGFEGLLTKNKISLANKNVAIIGVGGAAKAAAFVAHRHSSRLVFLNRTHSNAVLLAAEFDAKAIPLSELGSVEYDVLIQTTPVGMKAEECPVNPDLLRPDATVIDVIYEPSETMMLQKARALGCRTINGLDWFTSQAEAQFQWWQSWGAQ